MNEFIVPETGEYRLWTYGPGRREILIWIDGVASHTASSTLGPFGEAKIEIVLELARGTVITTEPENAPFVVRTLDGTVLCARRASTGEIAHLAGVSSPRPGCARVVRECLGSGGVMAIGAEADDQPDGLSGSS